MAHFPVKFSTSFSTATRDVLWPPITGSLSASHLCLSFGSAPEAKETSGMLDDGEAGATAAAAVVALSAEREVSARTRAMAVGRAGRRMRGVPLRFEAWRPGSKLALGWQRNNR